MPSTDDMVEDDMVEHIWTEELCRRYAATMRKLVPFDTRPWARRIARSLGSVPAGLRVADIATGPAFLLLELAARLPAPRLVAVDGARTMLTVAEEEAQRRGLTLETVRSKAEQIDLADGSLDVVTCKQLLHEADDADAVLGELARVLRPGGRAFVIDFDADSPPFVARAVRTLIRLTGGYEMAKGFWGSYTSALSGATLPARLRAAGFSDVSVTRQGMNYFAVATR